MEFILCSRSASGDGPVRSVCADSTRSLLSGAGNRATAHKPYPTAPQGTSEPPRALFEAEQDLDEDSEPRRPPTRPTHSSPTTAFRADYYTPRQPPPSDPTTYIEPLGRPEGFVPSETGRSPRKRWRHGKRRPTSKVDHGKPLSACRDVLRSHPATAHLRFSGHHPARRNSNSP